MPLLLAPGRVFAVWGNGLPHLYGRCFDRRLVKTIGGVRFRFTIGLFAPCVLSALQIGRSEGAGHYEAPASLASFFVAASSPLRHAYRKVTNAKCDGLRSVRDDQPTVDPFAGRRSFCRGVTCFQPRCRWCRLEVERLTQVIDTSFCQVSTSSRAKPAGKKRCFHC